MGTAIDQTTGGARAPRPWRGGARGRAMRRGRCRVMRVGRATGPVVAGARGGRAAGPATWHATQQARVPGTGRCLPAAAAPSGSGVVTQRTWSGPTAAAAMPPRMPWRARAYRARTATIRARVRVRSATDAVPRPDDRAGSHARRILESPEFRGWFSRPGRVDRLGKTLRPIAWVRRDARAAAGRASAQPREPGAPAARLRAIVPSMSAGPRPGDR